MGGGPVRLGILEGNYEGLLIDLKTVGRVVSGGVPLSADGSQNANGNIFGGAFGALIDLSDKHYVVLRGIAKKVAGDVDGVEFGPSAQLFREVDDNPSSPERIAVVIGDLRRFIGTEN